MLLFSLSTIFNGLCKKYASAYKRLTIIEKIGENLNASAFEGKLELPNFRGKQFSFGTLKISYLLLGIGLGLLIGFIINFLIIVNQKFLGVDPNEYYFRKEIMGVAFGASVLLFGGLGLLTSFIIEMKIAKKISGYSCCIVQKEHS